VGAAAWCENRASGVEKVNRMFNLRQRRLSAISSDVERGLCNAVANARAEDLGSYADELDQIRIQAVRLVALHMHKVKGPVQSERIEYSGSYVLCGCGVRLPNGEHERLFGAEASRVPSSIGCVLPKGHDGDHECLGHSWAQRERRRG
jgi:hypothetical protein